MQLPWEHHAGVLSRIGHDPALSLHLLKHNPCTKRRSEIENFIRVRFAEHCGAKIEHCMPCLLGLENAAGQLQAAVGICGADVGERFLERYLARPIAQEITAGNGRYLRRHEIVAVGSLAAVGVGHARLLIVALADVLLGFRWVTFIPALRPCLRPVQSCVSGCGAAVASGAESLTGQRAR
ncbi:thermostable hemolysin [Pseudomonas sp.]|uniref:thermostable hemolysin n=1 Tax=Pseudomonas sp. TaxID=306 RepID=UPI0035267F4F